MRKWRADNKPKVHKQARARKDRGRLSRMERALAQGMKCQICKIEMIKDTTTAQRMCSDHCHATGRLRGMLCQACNLSLGHYEGSQRQAGLVLAPYEEYLARWS